MQDKLNISIFGIQKIRWIEYPFITSESIEVIASKLHLNEGFSVSINGKQLNRNLWKSYIPNKSDDIIFIPDFGDIVSAIWAIVTTVAGTAGTAAAASFWPTMTALAVKVGVILGCGYLVQSLTPSPPKSTEAPSQAYSWNPQTTQAQGIVRPRIYGTNKCHGNIIQCFVEPLTEGSYSNKLKINALVSYGEGPVKSISDIRLNNQPSTNFEDLVISTRNGLLDQEVIEGFEYLKIQYRPNIVVKYSEDPIIWQLPRDDFDDIEILLGFSLWAFHKDGDAFGQPVYYKIEYCEVPDGEWLLVTNTYLVHQSTDFIWKKYVLSDYVSVESGKRYSIRVTKLSGDSTETRKSNTIVLDYVTGVLNDGLQYPGAVLVGITGAVTEDFTNLSDISAIIEGLVVQQYISGNWIIDYSDNPAWCAFDVLTQPVIQGDGSESSPYIIVEYEGISPDKVVLDSLLEWEAFCNTQCPDGEGNQENLVTFNAIYDTAMSVWDALIQLCSVSRCIPIWRGNSVDFIVDKPRNRSDVISSGNISSGSFSEAALSSLERISELEVTYKDKNQDYEQALLPVYSSTLDTFKNKTTLNFFGLTSKSEAWRLGRFHLAHNELLTKSIKVKTDIDSLGYRLGNRIGVQHDVPNWNALKSYGNRGSGRIISLTEGEVTDLLKLDYSIEEALIEGETYEVLVRVSTNEMITKTILSADDNVIEVGKFTGTKPQFNDLWIIGKQNLIVKDFTILNIQRSQDCEYSMELMEYSEHLWDDDQAEPLTTSAYDSSAKVYLKAIQPISNKDLRSYVPEIITDKELSGSVSLTNITWEIVPPE